MLHLHITYSSRVGSKYNHLSTGFFGWKMFENISPLSVTSAPVANLKIVLYQISRELCIVRQKKRLVNVRLVVD